MKKLLLLTIMVVLSSTSLYSQEEFEHHEHKNHFAFFVGTTKDLDLDEYEFTFGGEYFRKVSLFRNEFEIGIIGEKVGTDVKKYVGLLGVNYEPADKLGILIGAGVEYAEEEVEAASENVESAHEGTSWKSELLLRFGVNYKLEAFKNFSIIPSINWDIVNKHNLIVLGLSFGVGF